MNFSLSPFAPNNLVSRDRIGSPVPRQPLISIFKAEVWVEAVTEGGRRFMAAWREEGEDAARHRQEKREATRLGKLQSHTEA